MVREEGRWGIRVCRRGRGVADVGLDYSGLGRFG